MRRIAKSGAMHDTCGNTFRRGVIWNHSDAPINYARTALRCIANFSEGISDLKYEAEDCASIPRNTKVFQFFLSSNYTENPLVILDVKKFFSALWLDGSVAWHSCDNLMDDGKNFYPMKFFTVAFYSVPGELYDLLANRSQIGGFKEYIDEAYESWACDTTIARLAIPE